MHQASTQKQLEEGIILNMFEIDDLCIWIVEKREEVEASGQSNLLMILSTAKVMHCCYFDHILDT